MTSLWRDLRYGGARLRTVTLYLGLALASGARPADAQETRASSVRVRGIAYDSLRNVRLFGALVAVDGTDQVALSDSLGRFAVTLAPGRYVFTLQHANVDSTGLPGIRAIIVIRSAADSVVVAIPSFAALWRSACKTDAVAPRDSGLIFGTVYESSGRVPAPRATVAVSWLDFGGEGTGKSLLSQSRWGGSAQTDATGSFALCGVPVDKAVRFRATTDSVATEPLSLVTSRARVQRRDIVLPAGERRDQPRGAVTGLLTSTQGSPLVNASVQAHDGSIAVRTDSAGRFLLRNLPVGTQEIDVRAIGQTPVAIIVDVLPNETAVVAMQINKLQRLQTVNTRASAMSRRFMRDFEDRRRVGLGRYLDSTQIHGNGTMTGLFMRFTSVRVIRGKIYLPGRMGGNCSPNYIVDGRPVEPEEVDFLRPYDLAAVEVYARYLEVPGELQGSGPKYRECGAVVLWTQEAWR